MVLSLLTTLLFFKVPMDRKITLPSKTNFKKEAFAVILLGKDIYSQLVCGNQTIQSVIFTLTNRFLSKLKSVNRQMTQNGVD